MDENDATWNKVVRDSKKAGYRNGVSDGRDSNFQGSFDVGYKEGFKNGFLLGKYKGALRVSCPSHEVPELNTSRKGNCMICEDKSKEYESVPEKIEMQLNKTNGLIKNLHSKYASKCIIYLENKINP